ncbi:MAG: type II and III secretion system protein family protein [Tepidisphaeraceae bacterium]|jgi:pilus assembly protein CpaC
MSNRVFRHVLLGVLAAVALLLTATTARGADAPRNDLQLVSEGLEAGKLRLLTGKSALVRTNSPYKRLSVADPDIAMARSVGETTILLTPKKAGSTQLVVWDEHDASQMIDVVVTADIGVLQEQLKQLFPAAKISVTSANGSIVLTGQAPSAAVAEQAVQVATPYGTKVLNLLEVSGGRQVQLQVRFAEVSRQATQALGFNGAYGDGAFSGGSNIGQLNPTNIIPGGTVGATPPQAGFTRTPPTVSPTVTTYGAGQIGSFYLEYFVDALRQNNLLRILAEPTLVTVSGQEASFLAGGSFPIPVSGGAQTGGTPAVTVEFREYGVQLNFTPIVTGDGKIRLKVSPEVSDLDFTTAVQFSGFVIPGLTQRKVSTTIELAEGQTFAIAGLLNQSVNASKDVTPLLGDLPVLGALFRSVKYQRKETELVVLVTPHLVEAMNPAQVTAIPGEFWRHPTENDLFFNQDIGGPANPPTGDTVKERPPRFYGAYGFQPAPQK